MKIGRSSVHLAAWVPNGSAPGLYEIVQHYCDCCTNEFYWLIRTICYTLVPGLRPSMWQ